MKLTKKNNLILILAVVSTLIACGGKGKSEQTANEVKEITFSEAPNDYLLAKKFKKIRMVQLEATDDCFITEIKKTISAQKKLFVLTKDDELFCFDEETGKYIRRIGNIGEGPGEYLNAASIFYDNKENTISVVDNAKNAIVVYSVDGNFVKNIKVKTSLSWADYAEKSKDGTLMFSTQLTGGYPANENLYVTMRPDGTVDYIDPFAPVKVVDYSMSVSKHPMALCDDGIRFFKYLNDTIFTLKDGQVEPYLRLNLGRKMPDKGIVAKMGENPDMSINKLYSSGYSTRLEDIFETENFIVVIPHISAATGYYWIDKNEQKALHIMSSFEVDKETAWFLQGRSIIRIVGADKNKIISSFQDIVIESVKDVMKKNKELKLFNDDLRSFFEQADPEGNPCLVFYES